MNELAHLVFLINKWKLKCLLEWVLWLYKQCCLVLSCIAPRWGCSSLIVGQYSLMYKSSHGTQAALTFPFRQTSMCVLPCQETVSAARELWVWARPNDWQASSSSCKSGSGTRVEPLHLFCWIHICTAHSINYNRLSLCICVCVCMIVCNVLKSKYICTIAINYFHLLAEKSDS